MAEAPAAPAPAAPAQTPSASPAQDKSQVVSGTPQDNSKPVAEQPKPAAEKFLIKVNGKMRELSREDAMRELQKGFAAGEKFQKAASLTQKNQALLRALTDEGQQLDALKQLGVDPEKIAERLLAERAKRAQMTPEQQRIAELEAQLQRGEQERQTEQQKLQAEREEQADRQAWAQIEQECMTEIDRAMKAGELSGFKSASEALYLMAEAGELNSQFGVGVGAPELLAEAKQKLTEARTDLQAKIVGQLEGDSLLDWLGTEAVNKVIRAAAAKFKAGTPIQTLPKPAPIAEPKDKPKKSEWIRPDDMKRPFF